MEILGIMVMAAQPSVVTVERFDAGVESFHDWLLALPGKQQDFQRHYEEYKPDPSDIAAMRVLVERHGIKALVMGEYWCPDVARGTAVIARMAEQTGMKVRYFFRDRNKDIMNEFLKNGKECIPVVVFYDLEHRYAGHWIERPKIADEALVPVIKTMKSAPEGSAELRIATAKLFSMMWKHAPEWRHATLREIRELLCTDDC